MNRSDALARLQAHAAIVREMGATSLFLYGSTAREETGPDSDLDLFIEYDPEGRFNAFDLVAIKQLLEDRLGRRVDLTTRDGLHPRLRDRIEHTAVRVF